jgi:hypothetical protein
VISESFRAHGAEAMSGGERHQVVVHVAAETLQAGGGRHCEIEDGPAVAAKRPATWRAMPASSRLSRMRRVSRCRTQDPQHSAGATWRVLRD